MDTREVQEALHLIGMGACCGPVDGSFGPATMHAVKWFQQGFAFHDLLVDGHAGPQTHEALRLSLDRGGRCGEFFTFREFSSKGDGHCHFHRALVRGLDEYRRRYGPTAVVSGYRDPARNKKVGGKPNSQHLYGNAADVSPKASVNAVRNLSLFSGIGYIRGSGLVRHVDVRHVGPNTTGGTPTNPTTWIYG